MQKEVVITHNSAKLHLEYDAPYLVRGEQTHTGWKNWWLIPLVKATQEGWTLSGARLLGLDRCATLGQPHGGSVVKKV
jgi:hypothetical protein